MAEKCSGWGWIYGGLNPAVHWWFKILVMGVLLGILIVWGIDGLNFHLTPPAFHQEFLLQNGTNSSFNFPQIENPNSTAFNFTHHTPAPAPAPASAPAPALALAPIPNPIHFNSTSLRTVSASVLPKIEYLNLSRNSNPMKSWVSSELGANYSSNLLAKWLTPGGEPCKDSRTVDIKMPRLDGAKRVELTAGEIHEFVFQALDTSGQPHCLGGDYFELDLSSDRWKSRPPVKDMGNGSYSFSLQVHPDFAGNYNLTIILLFRHFEGLKFVPPRFVFNKVVRVVAITFIKSLSRLPKIRLCTKPDFVKDVWSGRWTRHARNDTCPISNDGRYRCQDPRLPCQRPWCVGKLGALESNGWVYSAHCSFKMFSGDEAWKCLSGRWIFWWGDSNHCDTIRNMLHFILGRRDILTVPRIFDKNVSNPQDPSQTVRFTSIFNGHWNHTQNYEGLNSLADEGYRKMVKGYFEGDTVPDTVVMNSGLHDGVHWTSLRNFVKGADYAARFWVGVMDGVKSRGLRPPELIYRTTVATGGYARSLAFNPQKMEAFNGVVLDKLRGAGIVDRVIDGFDMTFPWHFDNRCNDGVHYGRAPLKAKWRDGEIGHQYFVDLMLGHVLLNVLCAKPR